ncbi:MAG: hypothetical protein DRO23_12155 [Thermoprotei archaeon]|nr:MAG: hypothetical protein DRO23_12155 [Thermoprotei archaeon]
MIDLRKFLDKILPSGKAWDMAKDLIIAEEISRIQARRIADELLGKLKEIPVTFEIPRPHPRTIDYSNYPIDRKRLLIDERGIGVLEEFVIVSGTKSYGCDLIVDGRALFFGSFDKYSEISQFTKTAVAIKREEEKNYTLTFYNVPFLFSLKLYVYSLAGTVSFKRIYGKWHVLKFRKELLQLPEIKKELEKYLPMKLKV